MGKLGELLSHPDELVPLIKMVVAAKKATKLPKNPGLAFCYDILNSVSRSFAVVIQQLPNPLRDAICIFYLVLRGLDTVEDDMAIPAEVKLPHLYAFHEHIYDRSFTLDCGTNHYQRLMAQFNIVVECFLGLEPAFKEVITDITKRMGYGMAEFITKEVRTVADYDLYCHYVAGLVGIGLSKLFASSGLESSDFLQLDELSNHMGLFLQKTNIIRDYLEDILEEPAPRMFWPRTIWGSYGRNLADFKEPGNEAAAVKCLNHMITDALRHLPQSLAYMRCVKHRDVFRFCSIPQIMAAGTLALCYNNAAVFKGVVKMRRGQTASVFARCSDMGDLYSWFLQFLEVLEAKAQGEVDAEDPTLQDMKAALVQARQAVEDGLKQWSEERPKASQAAPASFTRDYALLLLAGVYFYYVFQLGDGQLPAALQPYAWVLQQQQQVQQALAALLLLWSVWGATMHSR